MVSAVVGCLVDYASSDFWRNISYKSPSSDNLKVITHKKRPAFVIAGIWSGFAQLAIYFIKPKKPTT